MPRTFPCPRCGEPSVWEGNEFRPFCSERCKLIDLGAWANDEYRQHMSNAHKGKPSGRKGKKHTEEAILKMSLSKKGRPSTKKDIRYTQEQKDNLSKKTSEYNKKHNRIPGPTAWAKSIEKTSMAVICYDLNGDFISEYKSLSVPTPIKFLFGNSDILITQQELFGESVHGLSAVGNLLI